MEEALKNEALKKGALKKEALGKKTTDFNKLEKRLRHEVGRAIEDFGMIEEGDKVMSVCPGVPIPIPCWTSSPVCKPLSLHI